MTGRIRDLSVDRHGKVVLMLEINERQAAETLYDELNLCEKCEISVKKWRGKRSNDANRYFWEMAGKLAEKTGIPVETIYREAVKNIGGNSDIVCVKAEACDALRKHWSSMGLGWVSDVFPSKIPGCNNVILYAGSSTYNTEQMSRLIDLIVEECKTQGIETRPPEEIEAMMKFWKDRTK